MNTANTLALLGILCSLGSLTAQIIYLRALTTKHHLRATCALATAAFLCAITVTITLTLTLP